MHACNGFSIVDVLRSQLVLYTTLEIFFLMFTLTHVVAIHTRMYVVCTAQYFIHDFSLNADSTTVVDKWNSIPS